MTIAIYIIIGTIWCAWLEYYTTEHLGGFLGRPWIWRERFFHLLLWPISLGTFILEFIKGIK
jgi:hypothetical protein|tara:strand:+ start:369 stop:554 length:186 start_codon:yes stop_codon:yes gene_type:complete